MMGGLVVSFRCAFVSAAIGLCSLNAGCASGAYVDLSAARVLRSVAAEMRQAVEEYHADLAQSDDQREASAIGAFITRANEADRDRVQLEQDGAALSEALAKLRADRAAAVQRYIATLDNISLLHETADGLKHHGLARLRVGRNIQELLSIEE